jgi:hypothetical protein
LALVVFSQVVLLFLHVLYVLPRSALSKRNVILHRPPPLSPTLSRPAGLAAANTASATQRTSWSSHVSLMPSSPLLLVLSILFSSSSIFHCRSLRLH